MPQPDTHFIAGATDAQVQAWLTSAQQAYADLMSGAKVVSVGYDGKSVTYNQADRTYLAAWIYQLQRRLGLICRRRARVPYF